ncbi:MAG: regulatory protein RecX [Bacteroidota bacterium]
MRKPFRPTEPLTPDEILAKMEYFCAYRERCTKEVHARLTELGARGEDAEQILEVLRGDGFFDEARFAHAFAGGKFRINHWGRVRIRQELRLREVPNALIQSALDEIDEDEYVALLKSLIEKKKDQYEGDALMRDKTIAALMRMGFEMELIFRHL